MNSVLYYIVFLVLNAFDTYIIYQFMKSFFKNNYSDKTFTLILYIIYYFISSLIYIFLSNFVLNLTSSVLLVFEGANLLTVKGTSLAERCLLKPSDFAVASSLSAPSSIEICAKAQLHD